MSAERDERPFVGILLAAGRGRRMGERTKQLLPWPPAGGAPLVAASFDAIAPACRTMVVVLGHEADAVAAALADRVFERVDADADQPMFESVRAGIIATERADPAAAAALVHPADHPGVSRTTLDRLVTAHRAQPDMVIRPLHANRGGHPVVIPRRLFAAIAEDAGDGGLRRFLADRPDDCVDLIVDDPMIVRDIDDEPAYRAAVEEANGR